MMFYKFILDSFSTSQFVFGKGRQCGAGRQKTVYNWTLGSQKHWPPTLILRGFSTLSIAVSTCISDQVLLFQHCNNGAFYSPAT